MEELEEAKEEAEDVAEDVVMWYVLRHVDVGQLWNLGLHILYC